MNTTRRPARTARTRRHAEAIARYRRHEALDRAARSTNAAYATNRTARTTGAPADRWAAETALTCARRDLARYAELAELELEVARKEVDERRAYLGALTLPVR